MLKFHKKDHFIFETVFFVRQACILAIG